jgi:type IV pilus assembly protein PilN
MAKVNLLPWRAERRKVRQREFYSMLGGAAIGALALGLLISFYYSEQVDGQTRRNAYLTDQIALLDKKIEEIKRLDTEKDKLLRRKEVIEQLQANRSQMVHLFDELVRTIPEGVRLTAIKQDGDKLTLDGQSQSNARVSAYMRNIEASGWMTNPELSVIEAKGDDKTLPYAFNLSLTLTKPGQVIGPDGKPVMGPDGKPLMASASTTPGAANATATAPTPGTQPAAATPAPAATSSALPPVASPTVPPKPATAPSAASSKGGATQ